VDVRPAADVLGRDFAWLYPRQDQVSFLDGTVRAFEHFGFVPHRLVYDNLRSAVARILVGSERVLSARFLGLATHYLIEASFARPRTARQGRVELEQGDPLQELVPIPSGPICAPSARRSWRGSMRACEARLRRRTSRALRRGAVPPAAAASGALPRGIVPPRRGLAPQLVALGGATYSVWSDWVRLPSRRSSASTRSRSSDRRTHRRARAAAVRGRSVDYRITCPSWPRSPGGAPGG